MNARITTRFVRGIAIFAVALAGFSPLSARAQSMPIDGQQHHGPPGQSTGGQQPAQDDMQHMAMHEEGPAMPPTREGSGTSWLPDETPMYALHRTAGGWMLMAHGNAFLQYLHESGERGASQAGSVNWVMGMADRGVGAGHLGLRGMLSLEPWTIGGCGYPDLLASGETCDGAPIHDRQHPHDLFMELAATYDRPIAGSVRLQVYGGPAGEPALGPTAFPHRVSAMPDPLAPITHHWLDATHISFGVVTGGVYGKQWKAETSLFNGREPDEHRSGLDLGPLDSWSGRLWFLPTRRWALQVSAGRLTEAEANPDGGPRIDQDRVTASATYHRVFGAGSIWASTVAWGRNAEPGTSGGTNALLAESSFTLADRDTWFGRFELSQKSGHDLAIDSHDVFTVAKLQGGYTRYLAWNGLRPGVGGAVSVGIVPASLESVYGGRVNLGVALFLTLRPGWREMEM